MSAKTQTVMSEEDFVQWELHVAQVMVDLRRKYSGCILEVVPAKPKPTDTTN